MAQDVGSLPPSQLLGVKGVEQLLLDAPVAKDGAKARRYHKSECSRLEVLKVRERARPQGLGETVEDGGRPFPAGRTRT